jgi:hypothetical protein
MGRATAVLEAPMTSLFHLAFAPRRTARTLVLSAVLTSAACCAPVAMAQAPPSTSSSQVMPGVQPIQLEIDGRSHRLEIDLQQARGFAVDARAGKPDLSHETKQALRALIAAQSLKTADGGRILVLGSNDDYSATGRAGRAGFGTAKAIRDFLIAEGVVDERILVAGWQATRDDAGALATLQNGGRALVVPLASGHARRIISIHGDPGRALAFDSAFARLTLARAGHAAVAPATSAPAPSASAAQPLDIRPAIAPPVMTQPMPSRPDTARAAAEPAARQTSVFSAGLPETVQGFGLQPVPMPAEVPFQQATHRCTPPALALDDFYPGGPIVACGQRHPSERRRTLR